LFEEAREIQWLYNALYARIALDWEFLDGVYAESIAKVDSFQGALWSGWRRIREEIVQVSYTCLIVWGSVVSWR
jgi:glutathione synthase